MRGERLDHISELASQTPRERLLLAALELFAQQGYAKTSIRQIALAAGANVAAVSYYFGNKAGLYREVFWGAHAPAFQPVRGHGSDAPLKELFEHILSPLRSGTPARLWIRLHRREMIEPTGLWQEKVDRGMQPLCALLVAHVCERLGIERADDEALALATMIIGPAVHLLVNCEVVDALSPQLLAGPDAVDVWCERLVRSADVLIDDERRRRATANGAGVAPRPTAARTRPGAVVRHPARSVPASKGRPRSRK